MSILVVVYDSTKNGTIKICMRGSARAPREQRCCCFDVRFPSFFWPRSISYRIFRRSECQYVALKENTRQTSNNARSRTPASSPRGSLFHSFLLRPPTQCKERVLGPTEKKVRLAQQESCVPQHPFPSPTQPKQKTRRCLEGWQFLNGANPSLGLVLSGCGGMDGR